ncbi:MAG: family 16 glycosylhydrolase [Paludibacteraceae bacterium]|nr:family 16 glycosylhydrolase [Paludibacteraceae bacterium]
MNLFFKKLTGKLQSTAKMEQYIAAMEADIARYRAVEKSAELAEYRQLQTTVESQEFRQKKQNLAGTKYKSTKYYQTVQELHRLEKDKMLQTYLQVKDSAQLKEYLEFRASDMYVKLSDKKLVRQSPDLKAMLAFEKSKAFKAYMAYKSSPVPGQYEDLRRQVSDAEFQKENAFWANPKRWFATTEHVQEERFKQLSALPDIQFFFAQDVKKIEQMETFVLSFGEEFRWLKLSESPWKPGFCYKNKKLLSQHSFANEQQANNAGKNAGTINGIFTILTKKEMVTAPAWDVKKGFVNKEFAYTSDILQTADSFRQERGLFMIKLRCSGKIHHAAWLGAEGKLPFVTLFHYNGKNIVVGNMTADGFKGENISGISPSQYYIYSLMWTRTELIWYVNNLEVLRMNRNVPAEALYLALSSFISQDQRAEEGKLEVDWIRVYKN